jgi:hypothetical protein
MLQNRFLLICFAAATLSFPSIVQTSVDPAAAICTELYKMRLDDRDNILSESNHRQQLKTMLRHSDLQSYNDLQSSSQKLGIDVDLVGQQMGLDESSRNDAQKFQKKLQTFLVSSDEDTADSSILVNKSSRLNSNLLNVIKNCHAHYFNSLRNVVKLSVEVVPQSYKAFSVNIEANIPAEEELPLKITQLVPSGAIHCTDSKHKPIGTRTIVVPAQRTILECTKDPLASIEFAVVSNAGTSPFLSIPSKPMTTAKSASAKNVTVQWKSVSPNVGTPIQGHCACASIFDDTGAKQTRLTNNCGGQLQVLGVKQTRWSGVAGEFLGFPASPGPNVLFGYASLAQGSSAEFDSADTAMGRIDFLSCPADAAIVPTPVYLPVLTDRPVCFVKPGPEGTGYNFHNICETTQHTLKSACTCPAQQQQKSMSGYVVRMNCIRSSDHLPCDMP